MTGTLATALSACFSPSPPRGMIRSTTPSWPASSASCSRPPETSETAPSGNSRRDDRGEHGVRVRRRGGAAQHDRVAGLQAQRGGVDGDVRPRLVDDGDDAERHAHLAHVEPVGEPVAVDHLADGVGQRGDRPHRVGDRRDPRGIEREPVHQRVGEPGLAPGLEVARVGLEDLRRALLERVGDAQQRRVLDRGAHRARARATRPGRRGRCR